MGKELPYIVADPNSGRLSYRRRYPADLRPFLTPKNGKVPWEFKDSLKDTRLSQAALARYRAAALKYEAIEREARQRAAGSQQQIDAAVIRFLADTYLATEIEHTNRSRRALPGTEVDDLRPYPPRQDLETDWEASRELLSDDDYDVPGIVAMWGDWVQMFAQAYGYAARPGDRGFTDLCLEMADASCRLWLAVDPHRSRRPIDDAPSPPKRPTAVDQPQPAAGGPPSGTSKTVSDLIDAYEAEKSPRWSNSTKSAYAPVKRLLIDAIGDKQVANLTREDARQVQELVKRLPVNLGKQAALKDLKVPEAIVRAEALGLPVVSAQTINSGYIVHIAATFAWATKEQWTPKNQFYDLEVHDAQEDDQRRDPFRPDQLATIFATDTWTSLDRNDDAGRYWLPLLGLYQGARLSELAGLRVMDVEEIDETTWALLIQPHALRALKTRSSRRNIPIHPTVLSLGFADFVRARKKQAEAAGKPEMFLFPGIRVKQRGQVGYNIGRWFSELVDELGLEGRKLSFHSLRHNFEDALRRARIFGTDQGSYLSGRSSRMPNSGKTYGDGWKTMVAELKAEMEMVSYPGLDLSGIKRWKSER